MLKKLAAGILFGLVLFGCADKEPDVESKASYNQQEETRYQADENSECFLSLDSRAAGVEIRPSDSNTVIWRSDKGRMRIKVDCDLESITLNKKCYTPQTVEINFTSKNTYNLVIDSDTWLKYGYLNIGHEKDSNSRYIVLNGAGFESDNLWRNKNLVRKLSLGSYTLEMAAPHKIGMQYKFDLCTEDAVHQVMLYSEAPGDIVVSAATKIEMINGVGRLRILTESDGANFTLSSSFFKEQEFTAPVVMVLPSEKYLIKYKGQKKDITITNNNESKVLLEKYINIVE